MNRSGRFRSLTALLAAALIACGGHEPPPFLRQLRCGMTREEVTRLARDAGYDTSDPAWLSRAMSTNKSKELTLVDLTFRNGGLVAVREGVYDPRTKRVSYRTTNFCASEAQSHPEPH